MRNLTYGFEHIAHRYRMLHQAEPPIIPVERRINLNDILLDRFGSDYAAHPRMTSLMNLNGGLHRHFLDGPQEIEAFNQSEFIKMHNSTLSKVGFFCNVIDLLAKGKLKTSASGYGVMLDRLFESRQAKGIGLAGAVFGLVLGIVEILRWSI